MELLQEPSFSGSPRFKKVNIEISNICNLQCSFCPEVFRPKKLMEITLFKDIVEQVSPLTEQICLHLMGDPLVHPRLEDILKICEQNRTQIFFVTNGVLLREKQAKLLLHPSIRQVNFSLHSFGDNFKEQDPSQYLDRIFQFTETAFKQRPDLYINYRLWNLDSPLGDAQENHGILNRIESHFNVQINRRVDVRLGKSKRIVNRLYLNFDTEFTWPSLDQPILGESGTCYGLSGHFGILVDGTVVPCCLDKEGVIPLGNIKNSPILEILRSPRAMEMLKGFQNRTLVEELCKRCQYIERFR